MKKCISKPARAAEKQDDRASNYSTERIAKSELLRAAKEVVVLPLLQRPANPGPGEQRAVQE